ncbi:NAD-dependent epimerase/dehydratase family protein [Streptomyces sp. NPDC005483]|uniref:NAD-dependent epimerase/dehydratase family protein n=1 Tax=Streptomyces sp. NPDC005483 TaxID=3154882 RepID=UPI0033B48986
MRVFLSGHKGFVGRHLHAAVEARGWDVTGIDLADASGDALDFFRHDDTPFDLAIHCAAIVGGRASIDGSPLGVATNLALDAWYMRWLIRTGTPRAVFFSSSAAYPVALQQPGDVRRLYEEDINLAYMEEPDSTYGWAKLTGEKLATYAEAEGCRILIPRPFSGFGEDQDPCYPFPAFIARAKRRDDPFEIWGSGSSTRDWIHIDDLIGATLALLDADVTGPVNLGWGRATSFDELARMVTDAAGYRPHFKHRTDAPQGVHHRVSDPSRMLNHYVPRVTLEEGVRRALNT